jgi:cell division protein FtsQ
MTKEVVSYKIKKRKILLGLCFSSILIIILIFVVFKSNYFIIKNIIVNNNLFVTKQEIVILSELKGKNTFLINKKSTEENIKLNPYIEGVLIKRKLPFTIVIDVTEKKIKGIVKFKNGLINIDGEGKMVQIVSKFPNGKIPIILGIDVTKYVPNECLVKNNVTMLSALKSVLSVVDYNESKYYFYSINIKDPYNIIFKTNSGIIVKVGDWTNIEYKIAYAIEVLKSPTIKGLKGYVQIQPEGGAIFKKN